MAIAGFSMPNISEEGGPAAGGCCCCGGGCAAGAGSIAGRCCCGTAAGEGEECCAGAANASTSEFAAITAFPADAKLLNGDTCWGWCSAGGDVCTAGAGAVNPPIKSSRGICRAGAGGPGTGARCCTGTFAAATDPPPSSTGAVRAYSSIVCMKEFGGFSMCGNLVSLNEGHELQLRKSRSRSSPCCVARLYASRAFTAWSLVMVKNTSMRRMMPSFTRRYSLNESFSNKDTPAITASFVVRLEFTASHSSNRRIRFCIRGSFSMSAVSSIPRISVGWLLCCPDPAASCSRRGILSKLTTHSSR
mmetsp:Transcript_11960/g.44490  ORF Transcript_11960/g.44490 Transcript_11960/m.44490 type:complete len:304 (+) Transcript_11960:99-1010(+)